MPKGKEYLYWFRENVVNKENEKFYGKIMKVVENYDKKMMKTSTGKNISLIL